MTDAPRDLLEQVEAAASDRLYPFTPSVVRDWLLLLVQRVRAAETERDRLRDFFALRKALVEPSEAMVLAMWHEKYVGEPDQGNHADKQRMASLRKQLQAALEAV